MPLMKSNPWPEFEPRSPTIKYIASSVPPIAVLSWADKESISTESGSVRDVGEDVRFAARSERLQ